MDCESGNNKKMEGREEHAQNKSDSVLWENWLQEQINKTKELIKKNDATITHIEREKQRILQEMEENRRLFEQCKAISTLRAFKCIWSGETIIFDTDSLFCKIYGECFKFYTDETSSYYGDDIVRAYCKIYFKLCDDVGASSKERYEYGKVIANCLKVETITLKREVIGRKCVRDGNLYTIFGYSYQGEDKALERYLKNYNGISTETRFSGCIDWNLLFPAIIDPRNVIKMESNSHQGRIEKGYVCANMVIFSFWDKCRIK